MLEFKGELIVKNDTRQVSDKFAVREFVIKGDGEYPQCVQFQATQDRCELLDGINVGDTINVAFNLRGREWTNPQGDVKYFNSLDAWRIEAVGGAAAPTQQADNDTDDVPF